MQSVPLPSLEYLMECSEQSLFDMELSSLNRSQQCLKAAKAEFEQALTEREAAGVARWLIDNRKELLAAARRTLEVKETLPFPQSRKSA